MTVITLLGTTWQPVNNIRNVFNNFLKD